MIRVAAAVEDTRFAEFVHAAVVRIAGSVGVAVDVRERRNTRGCRLPILRSFVAELLAAVDLVVVGADAGGATHTRSARSYRQKARDLAAALGQPGAVSLAIAQPSVEAWLMCDPDAFAAGLTEATGVEFRRPERWPVPRTEEQAKAALGSVVQFGLGGPLAGSGFEYASNIVARMDLQRAPSESLAAWARDLAGRLRRGGPQS